MRLVPIHQVPKALAIFNGGNALATVVAAPLGSYLGSVIDWRGAFFCLVPVALIALCIFFMGQFVLFTYVRPFLENVTQVDISTLSMILLVVGITGFIGTTVIGNILKMGLYRTLVFIPLFMALIGLLLINFGSVVSVVFVLLGLWGQVATAAPVGWWSWLARSLPKDAETGGGLMVAVIQRCIALGSPTEIHGDRRPTN